MNRGKIKIFYWVVLISIAFVAISCQDDQEMREPNFEPICSVEPVAKFPGGIDSLYVFYKENLRWPAPDFCGEGVVVVKFRVDERGKISGLKIIKSLCKKCDEEARRVINLMPNWIPATKNGRPISSSMLWPIKFKID